MFDTRPYSRGPQQMCRRKTRQYSGRLKECPFSIDTGASLLCTPSFVCPHQGAAVKVQGCFRRLEVKRAAAKAERRRLDGPEVSIDPHQMSFSRRVTIFLAPCNSLVRGDGGGRFQAFHDGFRVMYNR